MKKINVFLLLVIGILFTSVQLFAQGGIITTVGGCYACITTTIDSIPASYADFGRAAGISLDAAGNIYVAEQQGNRVRRIITPSSYVFTYAGNGTAGFAGDGAAATAAMLRNPDGIFIDGADNLYIADVGNNRIRKVDAGTGIINTIAGGGALTTDGIPATDASLTPKCVYVDGAGNIYTGGDNKLKMIDPAGMITTIAGDGTAADAGDGGLATNASIAGPIKAVTMDITGNIYIISDNGDRVRKIDAGTKIITTIAGGGSCTIDGIPATMAALVNMHSCVVDAVGNVILADRGNKLIRIVNAADQNIYTLAGGGTSTAESVKGTTAMARNYSLCLDMKGKNIYYTDSVTWIRKMTYGSMVFSGKVVSNFSTKINKLCSGPELNVTTSIYHTGMTMTTWFGDGLSAVTSIVAGCLPGSGITFITHNYANSGTYTIKQVLYDSGLPVDSATQTYHHTLCNDFHISFYNDANSNCAKDSSEPENIFQVLTEIDSNGIAIDTISATNGFFYTAYGNVGDVYEFKPFPPLPGITITCSMGGIKDTLEAVVYNNKETWIGFVCAATAFDLSLNPVIPVIGQRDQWGHIYVSNTSCMPVAATVKLTFSPKYNDAPYIYPPPASISGNIIIWNLTVQPNAVPLDLYFVGWAKSSSILKAGDTVHTHVTITPMTGDVNLKNNDIYIIDTVNASSDPNMISVSPPGCISSGTKELQYTIHFENTGNDTAHNIYLMDTLSDNVDPHSMRIVMASAQMDVSIIKSGIYNILKFDFPNINLLDSSHHGECDGAVVYTIKLKDGLAKGTHIRNRAGIYFDINEVVMTNTVENITGCTLGVPGIEDRKEVSIYPNPANDLLTIETDNSTYSSCTITNSIGQALMQQSITATKTNLNVKQLPAGLYYVTLKGENGSKVQKFVKL